MLTPAAQHSEIGLFTSVAPALFELEQHLELNELSPITQQDLIVTQSRAVDKNKPVACLSEDGSCCLEETGANTNIYWFSYI